VSKELVHIYNSREWGSFPNFPCETCKIPYFWHIHMLMHHYS